MLLIKEHFTKECNYLLEKGRATREIIIFLLGGCLLLGSIPYAEAQSYPTQPVEFVCHSAPGSGTDFFARLISDIISKGNLMPKPVVVLNKTGGGGAVALNYVAERNDPHTIYVVATNTFITAFMRAKIQARRENYKPIAILGEDVNVFSVREESPYKTVKDLVAAAKGKPKQITVGFGSVGGAGHLLAYLFAKAVGIEFNYLPHKSGGDAVVSLLGGRVDMVTENPSEMMSHVKAKKIRIIGIAAEDRLKDLPDVPTLRELGYAAVISMGRGFVGPKNTPEVVVQHLSSICRKVYDAPAYQEYLKENLMRPIFLTGKEMVGYLDGLHNKLYPIIDELGLLRK